MASAEHAGPAGLIDIRDRALVMIGALGVSLDVKQARIVEEYVVPDRVARPMAPVPDRTPPPDASEIERVVVLYYGRDGSRAGFEFTGVREVVLETRREEYELTITASQRRGLVYSPDAPWPR